MIFNLSQLEELYEKINKIVEFIENTNYSNRRQQLFFSNGERITISLPNDAVAHLLGINIDYLRATGLYRNNNSFELLKLMCDNPYTIYKAAQQDRIKYDQLFSKYINNKIEAF